MKQLMTVALNLRGMSVPEKIEKAKFIAAQVMNDPLFNPKRPTGEELLKAAEKLEQSFIDAGHRDRRALSRMREDMRNLGILLIAMSKNIEFHASQHALEAESIILRLGVDVKKTDRAKNVPFRVMYTSISGEVQLRTRFKPRTVYQWQYTLSKEPNGWKDAGITQKASILIKDLEFAKEYRFRYAIVTNEGPGPWSQEITYWVR